MKKKSDGLLVAALLILPFWLIGGSANAAEKEDPKTDPIPSPNPSPSPSVNPNQIPPVPPQPSPVENPPAPSINISRYDNLLKQEADKYKYDYRILKAIMGVESIYGTSTIYTSRIVGAGGKAGLYGITDIARTHTNGLLKKNYSRDDLWTPAISIEVAARLFKYWLDYCRGNVENAVKAYNVGGGNLSNPSYTAKAQNYYNSYLAEFNRKF